MSRMTTACLPCLAAMRLFLQPAPASAANKEWHFWTLAGAVTEIAEGTPPIGEMGYRFRDGA